MGERSPHRAAPLKNKINGKSTVKFERGNKLAKGGKRNGSGRPSNIRREIKKLAAEIAKSYIEKHIKAVMETYVGLAAGRVVKRKTPEGEEKFELSVDPTTTRHAVDKFLPAAKQEIGLTVDTVKVEKIDDVLRSNVDWDK